MNIFRLASDKVGSVFGADLHSSDLWVKSIQEEGVVLGNGGRNRTLDIGVDRKGVLEGLYAGGEGWIRLGELKQAVGSRQSRRVGNATCWASTNDGKIIVGVEAVEADPFAPEVEPGATIRVMHDDEVRQDYVVHANNVGAFESLCLSPDQTLVYASAKEEPVVYSAQLVLREVAKAGGDPFASKAELVKVTVVQAIEPFGDLVAVPGASMLVGGMCVDTNGWLYVATSLGIQVLDQAGRVNFIILTPKSASDVCFGGKDLGELFIACGDKVYKRATKANGVVSGQMAPIKPASPKL